MLETLAKEHGIGSAKTKILIAAERGIAVNVHAAKSRLKVKRDYIATWSHGLGKKETQSNRTLAVASNRGTGRRRCIGW